MALRWKRKPRPRGLAGVAMAAPLGSTLRDGETEYASTSCIPKSRANERQGWYWVARNDSAGVPLINTCYKPVADELTAKAAAMAYVRECIKATTTAAHAATKTEEGSDHE